MTELVRRIVVYTVVFGGYDHLAAAPRAGDDVRYVCITDREPEAAPGWEVRVVDPPPLHPYAQRIFKIMSHEAFPEADATVYLDANLTLRADPRRLVDAYLSDADLALFRHPERDNVYDEIEACAAVGKDDAGLLASLADRYRRRGMPSRGWLYAAGVVLRRHTEEIRRFNAAWLEELRRSSVRDQPALGYALWTTGTTPQVIDADIWNNDIVSWTPHTSRVQPPGREYLFVGGNPRSGTTALADLLNVDPRIVVGQERYRKVRTGLTPAHFLADRFFNPTLEETSFLPPRLISGDVPGLSVWPRDEERVRRKWASPQLRYVGDKAPLYVRQLGYLRRVFPTCRLVVLLRNPVDVAASYQRRADDPADHWPEENGWDLAVDHWNQSVADIRDHIAETGIHDLFLIDYETFYSGDVGYLRSLYLYLDLTPSPEVETRFAEVTRGRPDPRTRRRSLDVAAEEKVRQAADWGGYRVLRRFVPLMRDYAALSSSRPDRAASERRAESYAREYRALFDLSRRLLDEVDVLRDGPDAAGQDVAERASSLWRSHWGDVESMREGRAW